MNAASNSIPTGQRGEPQVRCRISTSHIYHRSSNDRYDGHSDRCDEVFHERILAEAASYRADICADSHTPIRYSTRSAMLAI